MKKLILFISSIFILLISNGFAQDDTIIINDDIHLIKLKDSIFIHTSWHVLPKWGRVASNGMLIVKNGQALLVDTPMDEEKTRQLTEFIKKEFKATTVRLIAGHYHNDNIGGLSYLYSIGADCVANAMTIDICKKEKLPIPNIGFKDSKTIDFNGIQLECKFPGGGHTVDNIVVFMPNEKILFGGCLIKSLGSKNLGYTKEADLENWEKSVDNVFKNFKDITIVVPGHGQHGGVALLNHTKKLAREHLAKK